VTDGYVVFVWKPTGYELHERAGQLPELGARVEENGGSLVVAKVGPSPLPGDSRRCVYLQPPD
jgi:hypothetical protein